MTRFNKSILAAALLGLAGLSGPAFAEGEYQGGGGIAKNTTVISSNYSGFGAAMATMTRMPPASYDSVRDNPPGA